MNPYPNLDGIGWSTDPETVITRILSNYCYCEKSASKLYRKLIRSLPYQLMVYTDPVALASVVQEDLTALYKNNFDSVDCTVTYDPNDQHGLGVESPRFHLEVSLIINDGVKRYSLAKVINIDNNSSVMLGESAL